MEGIWSKWTSTDGVALESYFVLTTKANELVKSFHNLMPVVVPNGFEE